MQKLRYKISVFVIGVFLVSLGLQNSPARAAITAESVGGLGGPGIPVNTAVEVNLTANDPILASSISNNWTQTNTGLQDRAGLPTIKDIYFFDNNTGITAGTSGSVRYSTNGGSTWSNTTPTSTNNGGFVSFGAISIVSGTTGFVAANDTLWKTTDSGATWTNQGATNYPPREIFFLDENTGWVYANLGGSSVNGFQKGLAKTSNGGSSWEPQISNQDIYGMEFIDANTGWALSPAGGDMNIYKTVNGGSDWTTATIAGDNQMYDLDFVDANTGWIVGNKVYKTTDGGETWVEQDTGSFLPEGYFSYFYDVDFIDENTGWIAGYGEKGEILYTTNGGATWNRSLNNGSNWSNFQIYSVHPISATTLWVGGEYGLVLKSADGGQTWATQTSREEPYGNIGFYDVDFISATHGCAVPTVTGKIVCTANGGSSWSVVNTGRDDITLYSINYGDSLNIWAVGDSGVILKSSNGGATWTAQTSGTAENFSWVDFIDEDNGWATGSAGAVFTTTDGGATWTPQNSGISDSIGEVQFIDQNTGYAISGDSADIMIKTTDGGVTWNQLQTNSPSSLTSLSFIDAATGWVLNDSGSSFKTTDGGATWTETVVGEGQYLDALEAVDGDSVYIGYANGDYNILASHDGGTTWQQETIGNATTGIFFWGPGTGIAMLNGGIAALRSNTAADVISLKKHSGNTQNGSLTGSNLCGSPSLSGTILSCGVSGDLEYDTWYTLSVTGGASGIRSTSGETLASTYTTVFKTERVAQASAAPAITYTSPVSGGSVAANGSAVINFSTGMNSVVQEGPPDGVLENINNIQLFETDNWQVTGSNLFSAEDEANWTGVDPNLYINIPLPAGIEANKTYRLIVKGDDDGNGPNGSCGGSSEPGCVLSKLNIPMESDFVLDFSTTATDNTPPFIENMYPADGTTGVDRATPDFMIQFNEKINSTTGLYFLQDNGDEVYVPADDDPNIVSTFNILDSDGMTAHYLPLVLLEADTRYFIVNIGAAQDLAGNYSSGTDIKTFVTGNTVNGAAEDVDPPQILYASADSSSVAATFSEPMSSDVTTIANWTLETSSDMVTWDTINLLSATISWDYVNFTATITDNAFELTPGSYFRITAGAAIGDISANTIVAGNNDSAIGTVLSTSESEGSLGPGSSGGGNFDYYNAASDPADVWPYTNLAGKTGRYGVYFKASQAIPASGKITLTFPSGFALTNACNTWPTDSWSAITVESITCNSVSRTATITLGDTGMGANEFVQFEIDGITNSSIAKDWATPGYRADIKTYNASDIMLESKTTSPFFIIEGGSRQISGKIFNDDGAGDGTANNDIPEGTEAGLANVTVCISGPLGFECKDTGEDGAFSFTQLVDGYYGVNVTPLKTGNYIGDSFWRDVWVQGEDVTDMYFALDAVPNENILDVGIDGSASLAGTEIDVFAWQTYKDFSDNDFSGGSGWVSRTATLDGSGNATVQLPLSKGKWQVSVGPRMNQDTGAAFTMPDFNFIIPESIEVEIADAGVVDACTSGPQAAQEMCFTLRAATNEIKLKVVDGSGAGIANAFVMANPAFSEESQFGGGGASQTDANGNGTIKLLPDTYKIQTFVPGMPEGSELECTVKDNSSNSDNNLTADVYCSGTLITNDVGGFSASSLTGTADENDLVPTISKGDTSISGLVLDENGNPLGYSHVTAVEVDDNDSFLGGWVDASTDANGSYTVYVKGGMSGSPKKWKVEAFAQSSCGALPSITASVTSGTNLTGKNIQAQANQCASVSGTVYIDSNSNSSLDSGEAVSGAYVNVYNSSYYNSSVTNGDGEYTVQVPTGTGYTIDGWIPGQGPTDTLTNQNLNADATGKNLTMTQPGTITVYLCTLTDTDAAPSSTNGCASDQLSGAYVNARDAHGKEGGTGDATPGEYTFSLPAGTYSVTAQHPSIGEVGDQDDVTVTANETTYLNFAPPNLYTVTGTLASADASCLNGATVYLNDATNGRFLDAKSDDNGAYSFSGVPNGTYTTAASKPGCLDSSGEGTVTVSGADATAAERTLALASATVTGRVWLDANDNDAADSGENFSAAGIVSATGSNGSVYVSEIDTSKGGTESNYSLSLDDGTWTIQARADGYESTAAEVTVSGATTQNLQVTTLAGYTRKEPSSANVTPSRGGVIKDPSIDSEFQVNIPAGALGSSSNAGSITINETTAVSNTKTHQVISGEAIEITPKNSAGQPITTLQEEATVTIPYNPAALPVGASESKLSIGMWDSAKQQWIQLPAKCDAVANTCTATVPHFSTFAVVRANDGKVSRAYRHAAEIGSSRNSHRTTVFALMTGAVIGSVVTNLLTRRKARRKK